MHQTDILADPRIASHAAARGAPGDLLRALRLGMPHLAPGGHGPDEGWLLSEAAHQHRIAVARACGTRPSDLRDRAGERAHPVLVSWVYTAPPVPFAEDDAVRLRHEVPPVAEGGWRSVLLADAGAAAAARIEIASVFARRMGPSNASLAATEMDAAHAPPPMPELMPRGVRTLRARSRAMRAVAGAHAAHPVLSVRVEARDLDGAGLLPPAALLRHLSEAEVAAAGGPWRAPPVHRREVHVYANVDAGDRLDIACDLLATELSPEPAAFSSIVARRASDGALVAACETARC